MTTVSFSGLELPAAQLMQSHRMHGQPVRKGWTRVQFVLPDRFDGAVRVLDWLSENCSARYSSYSYQDTQPKSAGFIMVVNFENRNDALMFKLTDGFRGESA